MDSTKIIVNDTLASNIIEVQNYLLRKAVQYWECPVNIISTLDEIKETSAMQMKYMDIKPVYYIFRDDKLIMHPEDIMSEEAFFDYQKDGGKWRRLTIHRELVIIEEIELEEEEKTYDIIELEVKTYGTQKVKVAVPHGKDESYAKDWLEDNQDSVDFDEFEWGDYEIETNWGCHYEKDVVETDFPYGVLNADYLEEMDRYVW